MSNIIKALEEQLKSDLPKFAPGDTVVVKVKVKKVTVSVYRLSGVVIAIRNRESSLCIPGS